MTAHGSPAPPARIPPGEIEVDADMVRELLRSQHPATLAADPAGLKIRHVATGWDNVTFRLGDDLAARLPRLKSAAALILIEQRWLPVLASRLPIAVPVPVHVGEPDVAFPWPWSVVPWAPGRSAEHEPPAPAEASRFGRFLAALHQPAPPDAPRNDYRGVPLVTRASQLEPRLDRLAHMDTGLAISLEAVWNRWREACAAPLDAAHTWIHGDLHPKNVVVDRGRLASVLDWGDMTVGDPATDLAAVWMLFPTEAHGDIWNAYGEVTTHTVKRAAGWAVFFGVMVLDCWLAEDPLFARSARITLERVCGR